MKTSEQINELAAALSKAQGEFKPAPFDRTNPHFRSKYATLTSIIATIQAPLTKHGLSFVQTLEQQNEKMVIVTKVLHSSGQWLKDSGIPLLLDKNNMQGLGSAISYAKRYGISAMLGIVSDEDDDGNAASAPDIVAVTKAPTSTPAPQAQTQAVKGMVCEECKTGTVIVSKVNPNMLYCLQCKASKPRQTS